MAAGTAATEALAPTPTLLLLLLLLLDLLLRLEQTLLPTPWLQGWSVCPPQAWSPCQLPGVGESPPASLLPVARRTPVAAADAADAAALPAAAAWASLPPPQLRQASMALGEWNVFRTSAAG